MGSNRSVTKKEGEHLSSYQEKDKTSEGKAVKFDQFVRSYVVAKKPWKSATHIYLSLQVSSSITIVTLQ